MISGCVQEKPKEGEGRGGGAGGGPSHVHQCMLSVSHVCAHIHFVCLRLEGLFVCLCESEYLIDRLYVYACVWLCVCLCLCIRESVRLVCICACGCSRVSFFIYMFTSLHVCVFVLCVVWFPR